MSARRYEGYDREHPGEGITVGSQVMDVATGREGTVKAAYPGVSVLVDFGPGRGQEWLPARELAVQVDVQEGYL